MNASFKIVRRGAGAPLQARRGSSPPSLRWGRGGPAVFRLLGPHDLAVSVKPKYCRDGEGDAAKGSVIRLYGSWRLAAGTIEIGTGASSGNGPVAETASPSPSRQHFGS